jgi:hypothetical protein
MIHPSIEEKKLKLAQFFVEELLHKSDKVISVVRSTEDNGVTAILTFEDGSEHKVTGSIAAKILRDE